MRQQLAAQVVVGRVEDRTVQSGVEERVRELIPRGTHGHPFRPRLPDFGVVGRTTLDDAEHVRHAAHPRVRRVTGRDGEGNVPGDIHAARRGLLRNGGKGVRLERGIDLDEAGARVDQRIDHGAGALRAVGDHRSGEPRVCPVRDVAGDHCARPHAVAGRDGTPGLAGHRQFAPHVANAGHPVGDVDRQSGGEEGGELVDVHVPQSRDEISAAAVHTLDTLAEQQFVRRRDGGNARPVHHDGLSVGHRTGRHVHHGHILDRGARVEFAWSRAAGGGERRHCGGECRHHGGEAGA